MNDYFFVSWLVGSLGAFLGVLGWCLCEPIWKTAEYFADFLIEVRAMWSGGWRWRTYGKSTRTTRKGNADRWVDDGAMDLDSQSRRLLRANGRDVPPTGVLSFDVERDSPHYRPNVGSVTGRVRMDTMSPQEIRRPPPTTEDIPASRPDPRRNSFLPRDGGVTATPAEDRLARIDAIVTEVLSDPQFLRTLYDNDATREQCIAQATARVMSNMLGNGNLLGFGGHEDTTASIASRVALMLHRVDLLDAQVEAVKARMPLRRRIQVRRRRHE